MFYQNTKWFMINKLYNMLFKTQIFNTTGCYEIHNNPTLYIALLGQSCGLLGPAFSCYITDQVNFIDHITTGKYDKKERACYAPGCLSF